MWSVSKQSSSHKIRRLLDATRSQRLVFFMGLVLGDWVTGAGARPLRGRAPRMSRVQPARAYDALYGAWGTRATPSRPTRATPRAPRGRFDRPSLTSSSTQRRIFADPVYTVSGARDHYREQARATNATETVPVRENMFAEGANYPAHETRCVRAPSPERPLPSIAAPAAKSLSRPYLAHEKRKTKNASRRSTPFCPRSSSRRHRMRTRDSLARAHPVSS